MPPVKNDKGNGSIFSYFKTLTIPKHKWVNDEEPAEEIVVAPRSSSASSKTTPQKRKRGRPAKSEASAVPSSSQSSNATTTSRKRARLVKSESQQQRDHQLNINSSQSPSTPRRSPAQYNINPLDGVANITPTKDSPFRAQSCTPAKTRVVSAIEINSSSSPKPQSPTSKPAKPPSQSNLISPSRIDNTLSNTSGAQATGKDIANPDPFQRPQSSAMATSLLTSIPPSSTLSSVPISSTSSSRRVTKNGLQAVKDSDSEDDSSSEDELPDPSSFVRPPRPAAQELVEPPSKRVKLSPQEKDAPRKNTGIAKLPVKANNKQEDYLAKYKSFKAPPKSPPRRTYRNSLASLVAQKEQWQMSRATVDSLEESVKEATRKEVEEQQEEELCGTIDGELLLGAAGSDIDEQDRMLKALKRTEALRDEQHYHFFLDVESKLPNKHFPAQSLPDEPWAKLYQEENRTLACISGVAAELASQHPLPFEITDWMVAQLCYEPNEALREAYVEILKACTEHPDSVSQSWGAFSSIYSTRSLFDSGPKDKLDAGVPPGLRHILQLVRCRALQADDIPDAAPTWTCEAFSDLVLMNVDEHVRADSALKSIIASTIEEMLDGLSEESFTSLIKGVAWELFRAADLPRRVLYQAITLLPASTARASRMRRRLALECFSTAPSSKLSAAQDWPKSILNKLDTMPEFQISPSTDYRLLSDLVGVLDVAIAGGWTDYAQLVVKEPVGAWGNLPPPTEAERQHNAQIDKICRRLSVMGSKILDAGTSHLHRTEAKYAIECVVKRLEYSVRARPKPKKSVFGQDNEPSHQRSFKQATFGNAGFVKKETAPMPQSIVTTMTPKSPVKAGTPNISFTSSPPIPRRAKQPEVVAKEETTPTSSLSSVDETIYHTTLMDMEDETPNTTFENDSTQDTIQVGYCYCNGTDENRMIGCDGRSCSRQWFHYECIGLTETPRKEKWFCKECKEKEGVEEET